MTPSIAGRPAFSPTSSPVGPVTKSYPRGTRSRRCRLIRPWRSDRCASGTRYQPGKRRVPSQTRPVQPKATSVGVPGPLASARLSSGGEEHSEYSPSTHTPGNGRPPHATAAGAGSLGSHIPSSCHRILCVDHYGRLAWTNTKGPPISPRETFPTSVGLEPDTTTRFTGPERVRSKDGNEP